MTLVSRFTFRDSEGCRRDLSPCIPGQVEEILKLVSLEPEAPPEIPSADIPLRVTRSMGLVEDQEPNFDHISENPSKSTLTLSKHSSRSVDQLLSIDADPLRSLLNWKIGIDVGGTFTDLVALNETTGETIRVKVPSTPKRPLHAIKQGLRMLGTNGRALVMHATTLPSNALLGQVGLTLPRAGLVTTKGFRDVLEIGRQNRPELYNLHFERTPPLM